MHTTQEVVLAADHAGFLIKEEVKKHLSVRGVTVHDVGTMSEVPVDYPAIIRRGCALALAKRCPAIVFGGSGNGEAMAANKVRGIRAAVGWSKESARLSRAHNDANVLSLGGRLIERDLALEMVDIFLETPFDGGRHKKRIEDLE